MINQLPWRKKLRTSAANNLDKINEIIDYINHSDISPVTLSDSASGRIVDVGMASSLKGLDVYGESTQAGVPTPDAPIPIQVVKGRNRVPIVAGKTGSMSGAAFIVNADGSVSLSGTSTAEADLYIYGGWAASALELDLTPGNTYTLSIVRPEDKDVRAMVYCFDSTNTSIGRYTTSSGAITFAIPSNTVKYGICVRVPANMNVDGVTVRVQLEEGSSSTQYVPYGHIGLEVRSGETLVSCTPIPLPSKGWAGSLPDGTRDVLTVDSAGKWSWVNQVGLTTEATTITGTNINRTLVRMADTGRPLPGSQVPAMLGTHWTPLNDSATFRPGNMGISSSGLISVAVDPSITTLEQFAAQFAGAEVFYPLATPTTESGYIDIPAIPEGATVTIDATIVPEFDIAWWSYQDITDMIADLKAYTDWKVSQVGNASTLSNSRLSVNQAVDKIE